MAILRILLFMAVTTGAALAQTTEKPLADADIGSMLDSGLPESTVLLKIRTSAYFGLVDLDASPAALSALKQKGASERILDAVVWAAPLKMMRQQAEEEQQAAPNLPLTSGVYLKGASGWTQLASFLLWRPLYAGWSWIKSRDKYAIPLDDANANLQIHEARPVFYLRNPSSTEGWGIVRFNAHHNQQLLRIISSGGLGERDRIDASQLQDVQMKHVAGNLFTIQPAADLEAGEYALCAPVEGGPRLNVCYPFGIQR